MKNDSFLNSITKVIHVKDPRAVAFLFGSRARGDNRSDSDWDILILIDNMNVTNDVEDFFRNDLYDLEIESGQLISTFIYSKDYWQKKIVYSPLYKNIEKEGIRL